MGAVDVAQHLHAMAFVFGHNDVPRAIKRYAPGTIELPVPCSYTADGAQVDVAKHFLGCHARHGAAGHSKFIRCGTVLNPGNSNKNPAKLKRYFFQLTVSVCGGPPLEIVRYTSVHK